MPFAVSKWPTAPDPRTGAYCRIGWDPMWVPPWQWLVTSTTNEPDWPELNTGVLVASLHAEPAIGSWINVSPLSDDRHVVVQYAGFSEQGNIPADPTATVHLSVSIQHFAIGLDWVYHTYRDGGSPIQVFNVNLDSGGAGPGPPLLGAPIITPMKWDAEQP